MNLELTSYDFPTISYPVCNNQFDCLIDLPSSTSYIRISFSGEENILIKDFSVINQSLRFRTSKDSIEQFDEYYIIRENLSAIRIEAIDDEQKFKNIKISFSYAPVPDSFYKELVFKSCQEKNALKFQTFRANSLNEALQIYVNQTSDFWEPKLFFKNLLLRKSKRVEESAVYSSTDDHMYTNVHCIQSFEELCIFVEKSGGYIYQKSQLLKYSFLTGKATGILYINENSLKLAEKVRLDGDLPLLICDKSQEVKIPELIPAISVPITVFSQIKNICSELIDEFISTEDEYQTVLPEPLNVNVNIIIPTYNPGNFIFDLIEALNSQKCVLKRTITIVDSGSSNQLMAKLETKQNVKLIKIPHEKFSHSYARNIGADSESSDIDLFMTQDAFPTSNLWLYRIIRPLVDKYQVVSCAEYCPDHADLYYRIAADEYQRFIGTIDGDCSGRFIPDGNADNFRRKAAISDVSCAIVDKVFKNYYYRNNYAEDLDLGKRLLKDGYKVRILGSTETIHYHNRPASYYLKRNYTEQKMLRALNVISYEEMDEIKVKQIIGSAWFHVYQALNWLKKIENTAQNIDNIEAFDAVLYATEIRDWRNYQTKYNPHIEDSLLRELYKWSVGAYAGEPEQSNPILQNVHSFLNDQFKNYLNRSVIKKDHSTQAMIDCIVKRTANESGTYLARLSMDKMPLWMEKLSENI
jgi:GT2 family glycosyltransferase